MNYLILARWLTWLHYLAISHAPESRNHVPDVDGPGPAELAQCELQEVHGAADENEDNGVGDQEGSSTVIEGHVGKTPNVTKTWTVLIIQN